jgi:hypothetical protein
MKSLQEQNAPALFAVSYQEKKPLWSTVILPHNTLHIVMHIFLCVLKLFSRYGFQFSQVTLFRQLTEKCSVIAFYDKIFHAS